MKNKLTKNSDIFSPTRKIKLPTISNNIQNQNSLETKNKVPPKSLLNINIKDDFSKLENYSLKKTNKNNRKIKLKLLSPLTNITKEKLTKEKLKEIKEKREKRLKLEKIEEKRKIIIYEQTLKEYQEKKKSPKNKNEMPLINTEINNTMEAPKIKISEAKAHTILEEGGLFDAYKYLLGQIYKNGFPIDNLFEYSAYVIENYEKKWKEKKYKLMQEKIEKYWKEKNDLIENDKKMNNELFNCINRSLKERNINKIIKSLDHSRSSLHHKNFELLLMKKPEKFTTKNNSKSKILVVQQNDNGQTNNEAKKDNKIFPTLNGYNSKIKSIRKDYNKESKDINNKMKLIKNNFKKESSPSPMKGTNKNNKM